MSEDICYIYIFAQIKITMCDIRQSICHLAIFVPVLFNLRLVFSCEASLWLRLEVYIMEILWLAQDEVKSVMDMHSDMQVVERAFRQHGLGRVQMPPKSYLYYTAYNGDLRTMPAYLEDENITGVKIVNVHPGNPDRGLPTVMALIILISPETGAPVAIMDGTYLTDIRTGAAGGIAAKYLARKDSKVIGLVGTGNQAKTQLEALFEVFEPELVRITSRTKESCEQFIREMADITPCEIRYEERLRRSATAISLSRPLRPENQS